MRGPAQAHGGTATRKRGLFDRILKVYRQGRGLVRPPALAGGARSISAACGLVLWVLGLQVGTELFPQIDSGQFVLRFRPPPGSNFELTRQMAVKCLEEIEREAKPENIEITMGFVGQVAPNFGIDNMVLFMRGPDDGQLRVALTRGQRDQARRVPRAAPQGPPRAGDPLAGQAAGAGGAVARRRRSGRPRLSTFGFEPGDIVTKVMSFGSPTPIAVRVVGTDLKMVRQHAEKIAAEMKQHPLPPRRPVRADARLPHRRGRDRPREGGAERRHGRGRGARRWSWRRRRPGSPTSTTGST